MHELHIGIILFIFTHFYKLKINRKHFHGDHSAKQPKIKKCVEQGAKQ